MIISKIYVHLNPLTFTLYLRTSYFIQRVMGIAIPPLIFNGLKPSTKKMSPPAPAQQLKISIHPNPPEKRPSPTFLYSWKVPLTTTQRKYTSIYPHPPIKNAHLSSLTHKNTDPSSTDPKHTLPSTTHYHSDMKKVQPAPGILSPDSLVKTWHPSLSNQNIPPPRPTNP